MEIFSEIIEEISLSCDKREFRKWFENQYQGSMMEYKDTPTGATIFIFFTNIDIKYTPISVGYKYVFTIDGSTKFGMNFIGTVRNTFQIKGKKNVIQHRKKSGRPHKPEDLWAMEQLIEGRLPKEVKAEWLEKDEVKARDPYGSADLDRQFRRIIEYAEEDKIGQ